MKGAQDQAPAMPGSGTTRIAPRSYADLPVLGWYGQYALLGRIAFGGMAEIFLARETLSQAGKTRPLVVKRILPHVADDPKFVQMFLDEARLANHLTHPNIAGIYGYGEQDGTYFIAMEWVHGIPLGRLVRRARDAAQIPHAVAARIIAHIAEALDYAHNAVDDKGDPLSIVHRDVSLQNIMVGYDGNVKLLDFGVAKASTHASVTDAGTVKGKLAYMAPEQARGEDVDRRADVFSLGVCLYEALTCRALYHRPSEYETLRAVIEQPVPSARSIDETIPHDLDMIVQKALAKLPAERFQTAGEMSDALMQFLESTNQAVLPAVIADFLASLFGEEMKRGPLLDATPTGHALSRVDGGRPPVSRDAPPVDDAAKTSVERPIQALRTLNRPQLRAPILILLGAALGIAAWLAWERFF
ncbi:MAG: serine/threonine protein kinase [Sandaracinaceae bacterium]|nr:serine/threonine protein kinase [Sandaracinaceae bacterium]